MRVTKNTIADVVDDIVKLLEARDPENRVVSVREIVNEEGISRSAWTRIRLEMLVKGVAICQEPSKGYYLGAPGEQARTLMADQQQIEATTKRMAKEMELLRQAKQLRKVAAYAKKAGEPLAPTVAVLIAAGQEVPEETMKQLGAG